MKRFCAIAVIVCLVSISCNKDDLVNSQDNEQTIKKEKLYTVKKVSQPLTKAVSINDKTWESGDTIKIKFLNGSSQLQDSVKQVAATWLKYAWLKFKYVSSGDADVKIGFDMDTRYISWATIGTDCRLVSQNTPSVNFVDMEYNLEEDYETFQGDVLRAFGHILGLGFEHSNPESTIVFKPNAQSYFEDYYGLSASEALELLELYDTEQTNYTEYDPLSIMVLGIPSTIVTKKSMAVVANTELSDSDKELIATLYPKIYLEKISFSTPYLSDRFTEQIVEVNNVIYGISFCGVASFDATKQNNVQSLDSPSVFPSVIGNLIYYRSLSSGGSKYLNTNNGTMTNLPAYWTHNGSPKGINGRVYFGKENDAGLYYFDIDGTLSHQPLYDANDIELQNLAITQLLNDVDGTLYVVATLDNCVQYIYTIDNSYTVELRFHRLYDANISLFTSPAGKIYYTHIYYANGDGYFGYIENGNMYLIDDNAGNISYLTVNKDDKIYCINRSRSEILLYENSQYNTIERDEFSLSTMRFTNFLMPLKHYPEIVLQAVTTSGGSISIDWFILNPDGDNYAHRIQPPENVKLSKVIETSDGQIYFLGSDATGRAFWKYNKD
ncbi:MAG: hypothetical protein LBG80_15810 [Bacteroidales bacterium]|jgi:hypothetical protein|nr:hypothetical protein [Bacteroidales bacterium]